jgi:hypothetical protein
VPTRKQMVIKKGARLAFARDWVVGEVIGAGGFGRAYAVVSDGVEAAARRTTPGWLTTDAHSKARSRLATSRCSGATSERERPLPTGLGATF